MNLQELIDILRSAETSKDMNSRREEMAAVIPQLRTMFDYDQQNRFHQYDLWEHSLETVLGLTEGREDDMLLLAALLHDIGKPLSRSYGEKDGKVNMHYFGHAVKSVEVVQDDVIPILRKNGENLSEGDVKRLLYYIRHHDDNMDRDGKYIRKQREEGISFSVLRNLLFLQIADTDAHILLPELERRREVCKAMLALCPPCS